MTAYIHDMPIGLAHLHPIANGITLIKIIKGGDLWEYCYHL